MTQQENSRANIRAPKSDMLCIAAAVNCRVRTSEPLIIKNLECDEGFAVTKLCRAPLGDREAFIVK